MTKIKSLHRDTLLCYISFGYDIGSLAQLRILDANLYYVTSVFCDMCLTSV